MPALSIAIPPAQRDSVAAYYRTLRAAHLSRADCVHLIVSRYGWPEYRAIARSFLPERLTTHLQAA